MTNKNVLYNSLQIINTNYSLSFDFDRFVLSKKAEIDKKPNPFEINAYLTVVRVNDGQSQIEYSVKYSTIAILFSVFINLVLVALPFFEVRLKMINGSHLTQGFGIKLLISILLMTALNVALWLGIQSKKEIYKKVIDLILNKTAPNTP